ncbi:uncharacterized protein V1510DRAFT_403506 [Dipodascopsis tothii]|uniref:uncharacterized protein n=1 Tax=Dipodascopsis tothii TaxID=44089 RepID=UPI0034CE4868
MQPTYLRAFRPCMGASFRLSQSAGMRPAGRLFDAKKASTADTIKKFVPYEVWPLFIFLAIAVGGGVGAMGYKYYTDKTLRFYKARSIE